MLPYLQAVCQTPLVWLAADLGSCLKSEMWKSHIVQLPLQIPVGEGGTTAWKTCVLTPSSTVTLYLDVSAPHAVSVLVPST